MHVVERPYRWPCLEHMFWGFWRSLGSERGDLSQNLNNWQQPVNVSNRRFKQSVFISRRALLEQAVGSRRKLAVLEVLMRSA
jgi:hypothetical protein